MDVFFHHQLIGPATTNYQLTIHQKLNGTESQRTPDQVSCDRAIRYPGLRVRSMGPVGDFLDTENYLAATKNLPCKNGSLTDLAPVTMMGEE